MNREDRKSYDMSIFINNLQRYKVHKNVRQRDVAAAIGVSEGTFSDWKSGRSFPRINVLKDLADYFGVRISDLIESETMPQDRLTIQQQELLDLFAVSSEGTKEVVMRILSEFAKEKISEEQQRVIDLYEEISDDKKELAINLLNTLK